MSITKQTDRVQIRAYATQGITAFDEIEIIIGDLLNETATVAYKGQNAFAFKSKCTTNAVTFGNTCVANMREMNAAITEAVTFIATNLGGELITLDPPEKTFNAPPIDADTSVESATDGPLRELKQSTTKIYNRVDELFLANQTAFENLGSGGGWVGPEYDQALEQIRTLTRNVNEAVETSRSTMVTDITSQLTALGFAA